METDGRRWLSLLEFAGRSLGQPYGRTFLRHVVLRHPLAVVRGLWKYLGASGEQAHRPVPPGEAEDAFVRQPALGEGRLLVATGFCQKPLPAEGTDEGCPAGRFNHQCLSLSNHHADAEQSAWSSTCECCRVRELGQFALEAGASFAILTSALDIARDILLPSLVENRFARVIFAICPYSVEPMRLSLLMCGLEAVLVGYDSGACADYAQWLRADGGLKPERTTLAVVDRARMLRLLHRAAQLRSERGLAQPSCFAYRDHVYWPREVTAANSILAPCPGDSNSAAVEKAA